MTTYTPRTLSFGRVQMRILLPSSAGAAHSIQEMQVPPGYRSPHPPIHHTRESCTWVVLEGTMELTANRTVHRVGPGQAAHVEPHDDFVWRNPSEAAPLRVVCLYAPGGVEQMLVKAAAALAERGVAEPTPEVMGEVMPPLWREFGIDVAGA